MYRQIESLKEYVLIAQDRSHVECCLRQSDSTWLLKDTYDLNETVNLQSIEISISMSEIYRNIRFEK